MIDQSRSIVGRLLAVAAALRLDTGGEAEQTALVTSPTVRPEIHVDAASGSPAAVAAASGAAAPPAPAEVAHCEALADINCARHCYDRRDIHTLQHPCR